MTARSGLLPWSARGVAAAPWLRLAKVRIAALCTLSAAAASRLASPADAAGMLTPLAGLFLLACGSGALNQCQEADLDARMPRTRRRPLPAGEIRSREAFLFSLGLMLPGLFLLHRGGGPAAALLGLAAVLWYNGLYTALKRRTALALLPGALVGAVPPAIGWVSAGGRLGDPALTAVCGLLFLWQVPHFGLLLLVRGGEYEAAGLPVLSGVVPRRRLARLVFLCVLGTVAGGLLLPLPGAATAIRAVLAGASLALVLCAADVPRGGREAARRAFHAINAYLVLVLLLAVVAASQGATTAGH